MGSGLDKLTENLDRILAITGLIFSSLLTWWLTTREILPVYAMAGVLSFLACATYLVVRKRLSPLGISRFLSSLPKLEAKRPTYLLLNISFLALFAYSVMAIALRPDLYVRPLGYFISVAFMAGVVAIEILFLPEKRRHTYLILLKIMLIALNLRLVPMYMFPGHVWYDPWWHEWFTTETLRLGQIPLGEPYSNLPIMHLLSASTMLISGLDFKGASLLCLSLTQVIILISFVFLLANSIIHNPKVGLLAALLISVADMVIANNIVFYPTSLGAAFMLIIIYILFKPERTTSPALTCISFLFMGALVLSHTLAAATMAILLLCFWIGFKVYATIYKGKADFPVNFTICACFIVGMFAWWMYASGHIVDFARLIKWAFREEYLAAVPPEALTQYTTQISLLEYLIDRLGFFLFYSISFIGAFYLLSKRAGSQHGFVLVLGGLTLLSIGFFGTPLGTPFLEPRWRYFSQIVLAIPASLGFILICGLARNNFRRASVLMLLIIVVSFSMITDIAANFDQPMLSEHRMIRRAFTNSEIQSMDTISYIWHGTIGTDKHAATYFSWPKGMKTTDMSDSFVSKDFTDCNGMMVVIREYITQKPFDCGGLFKLDYDPRDILENQGFNKVYDSKSVSGFLKQTEK